MSPSKRLLTRTSGARSWERVRARFSSPARAAEVRPSRLSGWRASRAFTITTAPRLARSAGSAGHSGLRTPKNLSSSSSRHSSASASATVRMREAPALQTSRSSRSQRSRIPATRPSMATGSRTSQGLPQVTSGRPIPASAVSNRPPSRAQVATLIPSSKRRTTVARPIPELPPVTRATRPRSSRSTPLPLDANPAVAGDDGAGHGPGLVGGQEHVGTHVVAGPLGQAERVPLLDPSPPFLGAAPAVVEAAQAGGGGQLGHGSPRGHGVDPDLGRQLVGELADQAQHGVLAGGVQGAATGRVEAGRGGGADHAATSPTQGLQGDLDRQQVALDVDVKDLPEARLQGLQGEV